MSLDLTSPQIIAPEFNDRLSEQLLVQPDSEYIFARWLYSAAMQEAFSEADPAAWELAKMQLLEGRLTKGAGGGEAELAKAMSTGHGGPLSLMWQDMQFPDMARMVREAKMPGEVIKINRPVFLNGDTTPANRVASPTTKLFGTNSQPITMQQMAMTIVEYLGPATSGGTLAPISLPRFTMHRSAHDLLVDVGYQLRRDRYRFIDDKMMNDIISAATAAAYVTYPQGVTSNATFTAAGNEPFTFDLIVNGVKAMKDRYIPGFNNEPFYPCVLSTTQVAQLKLDPMYQRLSVYHDRFNPLFPGYVKTVDGAIVIESTRLPTLASKGVNSDTTLQQGVLCAPSAYGWALAQDALVLRNRNDDGGRSNEFGWTSYEALQVLDDRFFQCLVTD